YSSRAFSMAMRASAACTLPTCLWFKPCLLRTKTSKRVHSDMSLSPRDGSGSVAFLLLFAGMGDSGFADPGTVFDSLAAGGDAFDAARAVALEHFVELFPLDFAEVVVAAFLVPLQVRVRGGA